MFTKIALEDLKATTITPAQELALLLLLLFLEQTGKSKQMWDTTLPSCKQIN